MNEPPVPEKPGSTPGNLPTPGSATRRAARLSKTLPALLVGLGLGLGVALALHFGPQGQIDFGASIRTIEQRLEAKGRTRWLAELRAACAARNCACAKKAAGFGLDVDVADAVLELSRRTRSCGAVEVDGFVAEALVLKNDASGLAAASKVLEQSPRNPNALYARALSSYREQKLQEALALAESSARAGRGYSATLLEGLVAYRMNDFARARSAFRALLKDDPKDVDALFNLGVTAQQDNRYGEARSNYLKVTRLDPRHADARYNLAILTHSYGAAEEARHHLAKFEALSPNSPRLAALRAALATPPEHGPAMSQGAGAPNPAPRP